MKKLNTITLSKYEVLSDERELKNLTNYTRLERYLERLYAQLGFSFRRKPRMVIDPISAYGVMVHVYQNPNNIALLDGYLIVGLGLSKNKERIIVQLCKDGMVVYALDTQIKKYLKSNKL